MLKYTKMDKRQWRETTWEDYERDLESGFARTVSKAESNTFLVGFKLMYDQLPDHLYKFFANWLNRKGVIVIHLVRKASVLRYSSHVEKRSRIRQGGDARYTDTDALLGPTGIQKLTLDSVALNVIRRHEQQMQDFSVYLRAHAPLAPQYELSYESLTGLHQERLFRSLSGFLGLSKPITAESSSLLRTNSGLCQDRVTNLELLNGTKSQFECEIMHAMYNSTARATFSDFLPHSDGDRCRFKFSHCIGEPR